MWVSNELKNITTKHNIGEKIGIMPRKQAFVNLKDHKDNFQNNPKMQTHRPGKKQFRGSKQIHPQANRCKF